MGVWIGLGLWLWNGGPTLSVQPTDLPTVVHTPPARTLTDIETDLVLCMVVLKRERQRGGLKVREYEAELDALQDEWAQLKGRA